MRRHVADSTGKAFLNRYKLLKVGSSQFKADTMHLGSLCPLTYTLIVKDWPKVASWSIDGRNRCDFGLS